MLDLTRARNENVGQIFKRPNFQLRGFLPKSVALFLLQELPHCT